MTHDYGVSVRRRLDFKLIVGGAVVVALVAAFVTMNTQSDRARAVALAKDWTVDGPPCPRLSPAQAAALPNPPREVISDYDVRYARTSGAISCMLIKSDGGAGLDDVPACKFNSPQVLDIRTGAGEAAFGPNLYRGVIVSVRHGVASCVVVPKARLSEMMADFSAN